MENILSSSKKNIPVILAFIYTVIIIIFITIVKSNTAVNINTYLNLFLNFMSTILIMCNVIKSNDKGAKLFMALGLCCLSIGDIYFILLKLVSVTLDSLSVGYFAKVCCFLFFISAITSLKKFTEKSRLFIIAVNIISVIATVLCVYSIIINNLWIINISILLLDFLCVVLALFLVFDKSVRYYAIMMSLISFSDILYIIVNLRPILDSVSPAFTILLIQSVLGLKAGVKNV